MKYLKYCPFCEKKLENSKDIAFALECKCEVYFGEGLPAYELGYDSNKSLERFQITVNVDEINYSLIILLGKKIAIFEECYTILAANEIFSDENCNIKINFHDPIQFAKTFITKVLKLKEFS